MPALSSHRLSAAVAMPPVSGTACQGKLCGCLQPQGLGRHCCGTGILNGGLAFLVLDQEIKLPGLRFTPPGEVLLASGRCSLQERVQDLTSSGAQSSARGRLSSRGRARHSRWPGSPFSACLAGPWSPIPAALLERM